MAGLDSQGQLVKVVAPPLRPALAVSALPQFVLNLLHAIRDNSVIRVAFPCPVDVVNFAAVGRVFIAFRIVVKTVTAIAKPRVYM